jgi:hypothetical protein
MCGLDVDVERIKIGWKNNKYWSLWIERSMCQKNLADTTKIKTE